MVAQGKNTGYNDCGQEEREEGNTVWEFIIDDSYEKKQHVIIVNGQE